ncbi:MAG: hypothetical protein ACTHMM_01240 [Agriterribacter sp.]
MPTKIVITKSDPQRGLINQNDYKRIIQDFEDFVEIQSTVSRKFKKIKVVSIPAMTLQKFLNIAKSKGDPDLRNTNINFKFGITLPNQKDCTDGTTDVSNHLTVVCVIEKIIIGNPGTPNEYVELDEINPECDCPDNKFDPANDNYIIVPGFKEFTDPSMTDRVCCPVIKPGS